MLRYHQRDIARFVHAQMQPHFRDEARVLSEAKAGREELREFFARDRAQFETEQRKGWKSET